MRLLWRGAFEFGEGVVLDGESEGAYRGRDELRSGFLRDAGRAGWEEGE